MLEVILATQFISGFVALIGLALTIKPFWVIKKRWQAALILVGAIVTCWVSGRAEDAVFHAEHDAAQSDVATARALLDQVNKTYGLSKPTAQPSETPASKWTYEESKDAMRGTVTHRAQIDSENELEFAFPYSGGSRGTLHLRQRPEDGLNIFVSVTKGQFTSCSPLGGHVFVKFDDGPVQRFSCAGTTDGTTNAVFVNSEHKFLAALRKSRTVIVEAEFYQAGRQQLVFDVRGLNWR